MKRFQKLASILLAVIMVMSLSTVAFAAEYEPENPTTVNFVVGGNRVMLFGASATATQSVKGFKLLDLTTSLKPGDTCTSGHTMACYNYAYVANDKYDDILIAAVNTEFGDTVDAIELIDSLANLSVDDAQLWADEVYRAIKVAGLDPEEADIDVADGATLSIDKGYWLFADITSYAGEDNVNSLVLLATKGDEDLTVTPKQSVPTITKKVSETGAAGSYVDTIAAAVGDTVYFQIDTKISEYLWDYVVYPYYVVDTIHSGLTYTDASAKVLVKNEGDADYTDLTSEFDIDHAAGTLTIANEDLIDAGIVGADADIRIEYTAVLNENAQIGKNTTGNTNTAYMEYQDDPYDTDNTRAALARTASDIVYVYTYGANIKKVDGNNVGTALANATFVLYRLDGSDKEYAQIDAAGHITGWAKATTDPGTGVETMPANIENTTPASGIINFTGLDDSETYYMIETAAPNGYNKLIDTFEIEIDSVHTESSITSIDASVTYAGDTEDYDGDTTTGLFSFSVKNYAGGELPVTGGEDAMMLTAIGTAIFLAGAVLLITKKRINIAA